MTDTKNRKKLIFVNIMIVIIIELYLLIIGWIETFALLFFLYFGFYILYAFESDE